MSMLVHSGTPIPLSACIAMHAMQATKAASIQRDTGA